MLQCYNAKMPRKYKGKKTQKPDEKKIKNGSNKFKTKCAKLGKIGKFRQSKKK